MTVTITLTTAGIDIGSCNLYSNANGYTTAFATGITRAQLLEGYNSTSVPSGTTIVRIISTGTCTNSVDIPVFPLTTTTTTSVPVGYIYVCNNFFSGQITNVTVGGMSILGASFPLNIGDCTSGITPNLGSQEVVIYYESIFSNSSIEVDDGFNPVVCQNASGFSNTFNSVMIVNGEQCNITGRDGLCY
jgi:hypothetical protein